MALLQAPTMMCCHITDPKVTGPTTTDWKLRAKKSNGKLTNAATVKKGMREARTASALLAFRPVPESQ